MTPEAWSIIATGIVILIAIARSNRALRAEFRAEFGGLRRDLEKLSERINQFEASLTERINQFEASLTERINKLEIELRERLARVEGILDVVRDSVIGRGPIEPGALRPRAGSQ